MTAPLIFTKTGVQALDKQSKNLRVNNLGVGYTSIMIIFALVCLVIFAVLSLKAAYSDELLNKRSGEYLQEYYAADNTAKQRLSELDALAFKAGSSEFFEETFAELTEGKGYTVRTVRGGCTVDYSVPINERQELKVSVTFKSSGQYEINRWQSATVSSENDDHLNVWDGNQ